MPRADRFLKACRREAVDCTPVWFMRQAGRYMKEYRAIRERHSMLEICKTPDLATEVTLQPLTHLDVDAAIIFTDILLPLESMGIEVVFVEGEGPAIRNPVRDQRAVEALRPVEPEADLPFLLEAVRIARQALEGERYGKVPLIGFAGAPFTLASYLIEGGPSTNFLRTKLMMYRDPALWHALMERLIGLITAVLQAQIRAGAQAIQLFDSWVGCLSQEDYREYVLPFSRRVLSALREGGVPLIHFGVGSPALLPLMKEAGGDVIGVDWRIPLDEAWHRLGNGVAIQGNLDPAVLLAPLPEIERQTLKILALADGRPGHIFNLGHGVLPATPVEHVAAVVELVHARTRR